MAKPRAISKVDRALGRLSGSAYGVFTFSDVRAAGISPSSVTDRLPTGTLWRLHLGVYTLVPPRLLKIEGRWRAAVLACGPGAVLSHTDAAALWEIHAIPSAFESDRARDAWLTARGYRVVRFTWRQLVDEPGMVVATLRRLLG